MKLMSFVGFGWCVHWSTTVSQYRGVEDSGSMETGAGNVGLGNVGLGFTAVVS